MKAVYGLRVLSIKDILVLFQVPLYAYGGKSCLSFSDLKKTSEGYDAQLGEV